MRETEGIGFDGIARPPRIYLDTNHLIDIANVRKGEKPPTGQSEDDYRRIDDCIKSYCGLIFGHAATLEWVEGKATKESASDIAAVVDSARLKFLFEADYLIYTREILEQCPDVQLPSLPIFQKLSDNCTFNSARGILANRVPDYLEEDQIGQLEKEEGIPIEVQIVSVRRWVEDTFKWKKHNLETYRKRVPDFSSGLSHDIELKNEYFNDRRRYQRDWIKRFLKIDRILRTFNPAIDVDSVFDNIDIRECPAVDLYWTVREKRMRSGIPPNDNDVDDYMYIPVIPYADIVLIEKQLRGFVLQADRSLESKVFSNVGDTLRALENQEFIWGCS